LKYTHILSEWSRFTARRL